MTKLSLLFLTNELGTEIWQESLALSVCAKPSERKKKNTKERKALIIAVKLEQLTDFIA